MLWPNARIRHARNVELQERVAAARRDYPESEAWLGLLEAALGESEDSAMWETAVPAPVAERPVKAPVLAHTQVTLDGRAARGWVRRLLKLSPPVNPRRIDGLALLEAAVCHDDARIDALAVAGDAEPHALRVLGQMAALPLLQARARPMGDPARRLDDGPTGRRGARARVPAAGETGLSDRVPHRGAAADAWLEEVGGGWWRLVEVAPARPPPSSRTSTILHRPPPG